ncbi:head GIN domain-containing protein [Pararcticibacter amylolyticus]|uniref:DUF2807 domain-containing protein n=1 Tax=Pararcticibacter amylolyticus TaxID=2173175 RepID=A0A2U2PFX3_9SPHI|nr:head GIN domain-containing protein [Pararcticibacter amylolyticus]PWG80029.1 DUF2807 domain-containing protein [Pararcticibacter amylolyticus]
MKKLFASFGWILLLLPFLGFAGTTTILSPAAHSEFRPEERQVRGFNAVHSAGAFDVYIKMGTTENLRLEGDEEQISKIETEVENGILKISYKRGINFRGWNNKRVSVYITARSIEGLALSGSGNMEVTGTVRSTKLNTKVSGSGNIRFTAAVSTLNASISGSGKIKASGSAGSADIAISGSGEFSGKELKTSDSNIKVSGSGNAYIHADKSLNAVVSGSGDVFYSGNPAVRQSKSGSGRISRI